MNYEDAKKLITNVLTNQRMTVAEHNQLQQAWKAILSRADGEPYGNNATDISEPVQPSQ